MKNEIIIFQKKKHLSYPLEKHYQNQTNKINNEVKRIENQNQSVIFLFSPHFNFSHTRISNRNENLGPKRISRQDKLSIDIFDEIW